MIPFTAAILAQGKNSRIGLEKSLLDINGITIIEKEIKLLKTIFEDIIVISEKEELKNKFPEIKFYPDIYKNIGPIAGIHSALYHCKSGTAFIFASDMPNLSRKIILRQVKVYLNNDVEIVVPRHLAGIEPLHAIYHKRCLLNINRCIERKDYAIRNFYKGLKIKYFDLPKEDINYFYNINTLQDYYDFRKIK